MGMKLINLRTVLKYPTLGDARCTRGQGHIELVVGVIERG